MFTLSKKSVDRLVGVHPKLVEVVKRAIELTPIDFTVLEGVRSRSKQAQLVAAGASRTMNGRHLTGHAVDLGVMVGGSLRWDWPLYYKLAPVVQQVAKELSVAIVWGGVWDKRLVDLGDPAEEVAAYVARRKAQGREAFIDGPHFELAWEIFP